MPDKGQHFISVERRINNLQVLVRGIVSGPETFVAVGTPVDPMPPAQIRTCRIAAYGSYLRYLASKRTFGCECRIFALGIQRSTNGQNRSQVIRSRWLRRPRARYQRQIT